MTEREIVCPACGHVLAPPYSLVPHDTDGCIVLRNRYGKAGKCINGRDCENCAIYQKAKAEILEKGKRP